MKRVPLQVCDESMYFYIVLPVQLGHQSLNKDGIKIMKPTGGTKCCLCLSLLRCLHSLSRSVQQLRTSFHDHAVWKPLMKVGS